MHRHRHRMDPSPDTPVPEGGRAAGIQIEKVKLHSLGNNPSEFGAQSAQPAKNKSRVASVSFRRTRTDSDGTPEIEAGTRPRAARFAWLVQIFQLVPRAREGDCVFVCPCVFPWGH